MPEMPEVEIIRRGLVDKLKHRQITDIEMLLPRLIKWPSATKFQAMVIGRTIIDMSRKGKYLLIHLDNHNNIVIHLRMTGRLYYITQGMKQDVYTRLIFHLDNGDMLLYADTRTLGTLYALGPEESWRISGLTNMGPEPLSKEFTIDYLKTVLANSRGKIKSFLLNQKYIGGLGNIYVDECLLIAKIHPERSCNQIALEEIECLHIAINKVIADGIKDGGTTFRDYRDGNGNKGNHQQNLLAYGRTGLPCFFCGTAIEKIEVGGRGTHFCPQCQH
ncbi:DNA-formamidopyrimidine glycosylase [Anaerosinus massiliensis]|uniref:DNA-formamidopyrimidine glycosylase n=1 Tax=Massilibacillus massiliensis TaxID=1806837 RepID=UPI000B30E016|nr:DNA-formamidopyrimidine glycosylase [Massilibacillus massiliensis]